jgi:hypothetical protein
LISRLQLCSFRTFILARPSHPSEASHSDWLRLRITRPGRSSFALDLTEAIQKLGVYCKRTRTGEGIGGGVAGWTERRGSAQHRRRRLLERRPRTVPLILERPALQPLHFPLVRRQTSVWVLGRPLRTGRALLARHRRRPLASVLEPRVGRLLPARSE